MLAIGIAQYLHNAELVVYSATAAATVFINTLPPSPDICTYIRESGGPAPNAGLGYDWYEVQIIIRGATSDSRPVELRAVALYNALHGLGVTTLPDGTVLINCMAQQAPFSLGNDEANRHEYAFNLLCEVRNTSSVHRQ